MLLARPAFSRNLAFIKKGNTASAFPFLFVQDRFPLSRRVPQDARGRIDYGPSSGRYSNTSPG